MGDAELMGDGEFLEVCMELLDTLYLRNYVFKYTGALEEFCLEETIRLLRITLDDLLNDDYIHDAVETAIKLLRQCCWRARESKPTSRSQNNVQPLVKALDPYMDLEQGTAEWHAFRNQHLTASSIAKALMSEASCNALIRSKCDPPSMDKVMSVNLDSTLHWGHKYEPVSIRIYERDYDTRVAEFGCIPSGEHPFIAASPDGINVDPTSPKFGRMVEVKNIVNREITGIPKPEYWVQMQVQMAVCKLDYCDFLETRFIELENREEMMEFVCTGVQCGCMALFMNSSGRPYYVHSPLEMKTSEQYDRWNCAMMSANNPNEWVKNVYWRLDQLLITEVVFDRDWYIAAYPEFANCWKRVIAVREGREVIVPTKKRKKASEEENKEEKKFRCLL